MVQINEETRNRRPIMLSLPPKEDKSKDTPKSDNKTDSEKEKDAQKGETNMDTEDSSSENSANKKQSEKNEEKPSREEEVKDTKEEEVPVRILNGLLPDQISSLVRCSVYLIGLPVDPDTLHALLRLVLRLTREHQYAMTFAELGGVKLLLGLTQVSTFQGFVSLVTLIIRHILEDSSTMKTTLQKVGYRLF